MILKPFGTLGVLGVVTGIVLEERGFGTIHEVMDHLFPGIMTIGCAVMSIRARDEILRQHPEFAALPECTPENWQQWAEDAIKRFGQTIDISGPMRGLERGE